MCGVFGGISKFDIVSILTSAIDNLQYRGYDSCGIALFDTFSSLLSETKVVGDVKLLQKNLLQRLQNSNIGIAHTRWATHGEVNYANAHPHVVRTSDFQLAVVHNGTIENYNKYKSTLIDFDFKSETDTEVISALLAKYLSSGNSINQAIEKVISDLDGMYSFIILLCYGDKAYCFAVQHGLPLILAKSIKGNYISSDVTALPEHTSTVSYLELGDIVKLSEDSVEVYNYYSKKLVAREEKSFDNFSNEILFLNSCYRTFMQQEIESQPRLIESVIHSDLFDRENLEKLQELLLKVNNVVVVGCGSSFHVAQVTQRWIEVFLEIPAKSVLASEYRYDHCLSKNKSSLLLLISQSGETADILHVVRNKGLNFLGIISLVNNTHSSLVKASDWSIFLHAGIEVGVAATKTFSLSLLQMYRFLLLWSELRSVNLPKSFSEINSISMIYQNQLDLDFFIKKVAYNLSSYRSILCISRKDLLPIACEAALKIKELTYIHAEAFAGGELKHGSLALVDSDVASLIFIAQDEVVNKNLITIQEILARKGHVFAIIEEGVDIEKHDNLFVLTVPAVPNHLRIFAFVPFLQKLSLHMAESKGLSVDRPRNLAKSVTVE